ncbi:MAG TPA: dihydropteroate synthase [Gemmatimonadales bacterium]|nr:dihydropteroate synthase [Gemmatimonadales bacterium]
MTVTPLALHSPRALQATLGAHGWDAGVAAAAAGGLRPLAFHLTELDPETVEALVRLTGSLGLDILTGDGWAVLAGSRSRLGALARPWTVPPVLAPLATEIGLALPAEPVQEWRTARGPVRLDRPAIMGILNVTPDSFSDGGRYLGLEAAVAQAEALLEAGAGLLDIGGESTRPGRVEAVPTEVELARVLPVIDELARRFPQAILTIDTVKAEVGQAALEAGAAAVNDVTGFRLEPGLARVVARYGAGAVLMHSRGGILELASYTHAVYADVVAEVVAELRIALQAATAAGIAPDAVALDPGLGFSKTPEQTLTLFDQLEALQALGRPLLVGPSRKRFLGTATGGDVADRDQATAAACVLAWERGARIFRVHDVAAARQALAVAQAVTGA